MQVGPSMNACKERNSLILVSTQARLLDSPLDHQLAMRCTETRIRGSAGELHDMEQMPI